MRHQAAWLILMMISVKLHAQMAGPTWYFGHYAGVDFSSGSPAALNNSAMHVFEGCATVSDLDGNLLFYTNGRKIWDQNHNLMPNGSGLKGDTSSAQHLVVRNPDTCYLYYVFTMGSHLTNNGSGGAFYSVVNMKLNGGLGDVDAAQKNVLLLNETSEGITAVRHGNGVDFWVVIHKLYSTDFYAYPVTSSGVGAPVISSAGNYRDNLTIIGQLEANHQGDLLGMTVMFAQPSVALFDFDSYTGVVSNEVEITNSFPLVSGFYGMEFSKTNNLLYVTQSFGTSYVQQYDLSSSLLTTLADVPGNYIFGSIERGPDERLYIARYQQPYLDVILYPEEPGAGCGYDDLYVDLDSGICMLGLPNHASFYFNEPKYDPCQVATTLPEIGPGPMDVRIYPNPAGTALHVQGMPSSTEFPVCILDVAGNVLLFQNQDGSSEISMDISSLPAGLYLLKAGSSVFSFMKK